MYDKEIILFSAVCFYLIILNIISFIAYGSDKRKAKKHKRRIPEKTLLTLAGFGGSMGALLGMVIFHHKTKKPAFGIGVPIMLTIQTALVIYLFYKSMSTT